MVRSSSQLATPTRRWGLLLPTLLLALMLSGCDLFGNSAATPTAIGNNSSTVVAGTPVAGDNGSPAPTSGDKQPTTVAQATTAPDQPTVAVEPPTATPPSSQRSMALTVNDAFSGQPIPRAVIEALPRSGAAINATTDANGTYNFASLEPGTAIKITAADYHSANVDSASLDKVTASLIPSTMRGKVTDATTGQPLPNVMVRVVALDAPAAPPADSQPPSVQPVITATPGAQLYGPKVAAAAVLTEAPPLPSTDGGISGPAQYVVVTGTDGDGLSMVVEAKAGAERVGVIPENTVLQIIGPDATNPDNNLVYANVQTLDGTKKGYCARQFLATDAGPNQPTFTPVPPTATPVPPPKSDLLQQPITTSKLIAFTDENGEYTLRDVPLNPMLHFKYAGYELTRVQVNNESRKDVALKQFRVKAVYFTVEYAASSELIDEQLKMIAGKDINAVVLNVQTNQTADYHGINIAYAGSNIPLLKETGEDIYFKNLPAFVKKLQDQYGLYVIARISTFVQPDLVQNRPDLAIKNASTGKPIRGGLGQLWLDMTNPAVREHLYSQIREVSKLGFDEIQMDYVRFPSDTEGGGLVYSAGPVADHPDKAQWLEKFLTEAYEQVRYTDVFFSTDVFGYILWPDQEEGPVNRTIGQVWEYVIKHVDYISPMIYPSHFSPGEMGFDRPNDHPYEIIKRSGEYAAARLKRTGDNPGKYRPWLQYFTMNGNLDYTGDVIRLQTKAAEETGTWGWIMWDASNSYQYPDAFDAKPKP